MKTINASIKARIIDKARSFWPIDKGCWEWPGSRNPRSGYGQISTSIAGKPVLFTAHRAMWEALYGPTTLCVLHRCDNPACFRPDHLFLGTHKDNTKDMFAKGRQQDYLKQARGMAHGSVKHPERLKRGEDNASAKIAASDVRAIRASVETLAVLARRYEMTEAGISAVRRRKTWKHLP